MTTKQKAFRWLLFAWLAVTIWASFFYAPLSQGFAGKMGDAPQSSRIVFFHVPLAVASFVAFLAAAVWSGALPLEASCHRRSPRSGRHRGGHGVLRAGHGHRRGVVEGAVGRLLELGPAAVEHRPGAALSTAPISACAAPSKTARCALACRRSTPCSASWSRRSSSSSCRAWPAFSLHPKPGGAEMDPEIGRVVLASITGFTALFFWMASLRRRSLDLDLETID